MPRGGNNRRKVGARWTTCAGYVLIKTPLNGWRRLHIVRMEEHLGRRLLPGELVHHKNGRKNDNRLRNLELMQRGEHTSLHWTGRVHSEQTRAKMRLRPQSLKGVKKSPEHAARIAVGHRGLKYSSAHRAAIAAGNRRRWASASAAARREHARRIIQALKDPAARAKISAAAVRRENVRRHRH